jgi:nucleoside triphosphate diphosphatase
MSEVDKLREVMRALRDPRSGCPWDLRQTFESVAPYTVEEAYEVADAIARKDLDGLRDELGDLLFQVVFHAQMASEQGAFDLEAVAAGITKKMRRRHPHVFGSAEERRAGPESGSWETIKAAERDERAGQAVSALDGIATALPALKRAGKLGKRAARVGFDWPDATGVHAKIREELRELDGAASPAAVREELGDLLFATANLARHLGVDAEDALDAANRKFESRFRHMERALLDAGRDPERLSLDELEAAWQATKRVLADDR